MRILALDFEGTSKEPRQGYPAQIGVAVMDGETVIASDEWLHRQPRHWKTNAPTRVVDANSLAIWDMTLDRLEAEGISLTDGCYRLQDFVRDNQAANLPVVAYNFTYDAECYGQMLFEAGTYNRYEGRYIPFQGILGPRWICAYQMARLKLDLDGYKLDDVALRFGLARDGEHHGAVMDAILAGRIYHRMMEGAKVAA